MRKPIYYLVHSETHERCFRYYETLAGARIAQRSRNARLGFDQRHCRVEEQTLEFEQCELNGRLVLATWVIEHGTVEIEDMQGPAVEN